MTRRESRAGLPLLYFCLLHQHRDQLKSRLEKQPEQDSAVEKPQQQLQLRDAADKDVAHLRFLFDSYEVRGERARDSCHFA